MRWRALAGRLRSRAPDVVKRRRICSTVRRFHRLYYDNSTRTWQNTRWLGVRVSKCPLDLWIYQELIAELRPEVIVETGTFLGGGTLYLACCLDLVGRGRVISVDNVEQPNRPEHDRITYVHGSSVDPEIVDAIRQEVGSDSRVLVIIDSENN